MEQGFHKRNLFNLLNFLKAITALIITSGIYVLLILLINIFAGNQLIYFIGGKNILLVRVIFIFSSIVIFIGIHECIIRILGLNPNLKNNLRLLLISTMICWIVIEIALSILKINASNCEITGNKTYNSLYFKSENENYPSNYTYNFPSNEFIFYRRTNSLGICDKEFDFNKADGEYRIIGCGDSFTVGVGVTEDSTWVRLLENTLNGAKKGKFSCINGGKAGSDPFFEYMLLKNTLIKYDPDMVILAVNEADLHDISKRGGDERFQKEGNWSVMSPPDWEWVYASSYLFRFLMINGLHFNNFLVNRNEWEKIENQSKEKLYNKLKDFEILAKQEGFHFIVAAFPAKVDFGNINNPLKDVIMKVQKYSKTNIVDLKDYFMKVEKINQSNIHKFYWTFDGHPRGKGQAAFARGLALKLVEMGIIDTTKNKPCDK